MAFPELARQKSAPDVLERLRRHRRVPHRIGDRGVSKIVLEPPRIHSATRQCVSCRMAQHVNVDRERQLGGLASPLNHASDAHAPEGVAALVHEYVAGFSAFGPP